EAEAHKALAQLRDEAVLEVNRRENAGKTWSDLVNGWEDFLLQGDGITNPLSPPTVADYAGSVRKHTDSWMEREACTIVRQDVRALLSQVGETISPIRAQKLRVWLKGIF